MFQVWDLTECERDKVCVFISYHIICPCLNCYAWSTVVSVLAKLSDNQFVFTEQLDKIHNCCFILAD